MSDFSKIRVVTVDDHKVFREGLKNMIAEEDDLEFVGEAENGRDAIALVSEIEPDVIIMDISMPDLNGIDATRLLIKDNPDLKIIALSMHTDKQYVSSMIQAGVLGYVAKDSAFEQVVTAIRQVNKRKLYLSPEIDEVVKQDYVNLVSGKDSVGASPLSTREREILQLIAEGIPTKQIAEKLFLSLKTVETHRSNIMNKLELYSVAELTKYAIQQGITSL